MERLLTNSPVHVCCVADLKPWAVPSELSGGFAGAGQQQGATGLWVHQQFEQSRWRVVSELNGAFEPPPGRTVGRGQRAGDTAFEQLKCTGVCRDGRTLQFDGQSWTVPELSLIHISEPTRPY